MVCMSQVDEYTLMAERPSGRFEVRAFCFSDIFAMKCAYRPNWEGLFPPFDSLGFRVHFMLH
jgi:hypothetical protein